MTDTQISADSVKELRERTGAGFMDCKRALEESGGDLEKAVALLRERGVAAAAQEGRPRCPRGTVSAYIHPGGRIGVLVEVNCETDFVARTEDFQKLVRDIAMQIAGLAPQYATIESIPPEVLEAKRPSWPTTRSCRPSRRASGRRSSRASCASGSPRSCSTSSPSAIPTRPWAS